MATTIRAVTLDLDGTLVDDSAGVALATEALARELAGEHAGVAVDTLMRIHADVHRRVWTPVYAAPPPTTPEAWDPAPLTTRVWHTTLEEAGIDPGERAPSIAERWLNDWSHASRAYDESAGVITRLQREGYRLGIVTNGSSRFQWLKIRRAGFDHTVGHIAVSGDRGAGKPNPEIFLSLLESLGVEPSAAVHVGDSLSADVGGAAGAGMKSVWINRTGASPGPDAARPDAVITSLAELPHALAKL